MPELLVYDFIRWHLYTLQCWSMLYELNYYIIFKQLFYWNIVANQILSICDWVMYVRYILEMLFDCLTLHKIRACITKIKKDRISYETLSLYIVKFWICFSIEISKTHIRTNSTLLCVCVCVILQDCYRTIRKKKNCDKRTQLES